MLNRPTPDQTTIHRVLLEAEGWLELGSAQTAWAELSALEPASRARPAVLHQSARILVALGRMEEAREVVRRISRSAPALRMTLLDDPALEPLWLGT